MKTSLLLALAFGAANGAKSTKCDADVATDRVSTALAGGTLYVSDGSDAEFTHVIDLGDAAVAAGCAPKFKPHMVLPSPDGGLVAVSYTGDTFVHLLDAATKEVVACLDATNPAVGVEAKTIHTGAWFGDGFFLMCDMTGSVGGVGGGAIHKFSVDRATNEAAYVASVSMGGPDVQAARGTGGTKPIALETNRLGAYAHLYVVTDAKGGGSIVDAEAMAIAAHLPVAETRCPSGGLWVEPHPTDEALVVAQYGAAGDAGAADECLVTVDLAAKKVAGVFELPAAADDAHGLQFCAAADGRLFLVNTNRGSTAKPPTLDVLDAATGAVVVGDLLLNGLVPEAVDGGRDILQPDVTYHDDAAKRLYVAGRGPEPVSAVKAGNFNPDAVAGLYVFSLSENCDAVAFEFLKPVDTARPQSGNRADCHGVWGVNDEVWIIDQAATGSVKTTETFFHCAADEILEDSASWHKRGAPEKDCAWVGGHLPKRCDVKGADKVTARDACAATCAGA